MQTPANRCDPLAVPRRGKAPRQGRFSDREPPIGIPPEFADGLLDVGKHPCLVLLYWPGRADRYTLFAISPGTGTEHGVFATRSPDRPNPPGLCVADIVRKEGKRLVVRGCLTGWTGRHSPASGRIQLNRLHPGLTLQPDGMPRSPTFIVLQGQLVKVQIGFL
ncbi:MAG: TrmO family methyltransferase [Methanoregula sp.]|uniref:TrmO family methyltransferase domain-containing protein n=1 Tax=Methanoregula sp. TaxID=2052170 RepID=UPI003D0D7D7A